MILEVAKGDSINFRSTLGEPIVAWKIRAEIWDDDDNIVKKATLNSGGGDDQVIITNGPIGEFVVIVNKGETANFLDLAYIEIEAETPLGEVFTILQDTISFTNEKIDWVVP